MQEASEAGSPYPSLRDYGFETYLAEARAELSVARRALKNEWRRGPLRTVGHLFRELASAWSGAEHETAIAALHRAEGLLLMLMSHDKLRSEALKIDAAFQETDDIRLSDPRHAVYTALFQRLSGIAVASGGPEAGKTKNPQDPQAGDSLVQVRPVEVADRVMLREVRRQQDESWEVARSRVRIFRNILSATIPFITLVLVVAALIGWSRPDLISLRGTSASGSPAASDIAIVEFLGGLGGLLSGVGTLRALSNFQRYYGLPLAQSILKMPAGALTALAGMVLLQHGLFGSIASIDWEKAIPYSIIFGISQITVTKRIDARASDLLGVANSKSPTTTQIGSTGSGSGNAG